MSDPSTEVDFFDLINSSVDPRVVAEGQGFLIAELVENVYEIALDSEEDNIYLLAASYFADLGMGKAEVVSVDLEHPSRKTIFLVLVTPE